MYRQREGLTERTAVVKTGFRPRQVMRRIDPALVREMESHLHCRKAEHVMEVLGISLNTWNKLLDGEPIRASVAQRLVDRFDIKINC